MRTARTFAFFASAALALALAAGPSAAQGPGESANGHGTLPSVNDAGQTVKRQFSFSAQRRADGTVSGHATLVNPAFPADRQG